MIATHTIKKNGVLYKAGQEIPEVVESLEPAVVKETVLEAPKRRSKKNRTVNEE